MKNIFLLLLFLCVNPVRSQTPFNRIYTILNTKCQNASCHSVNAPNSSASLRFDENEATVYVSIFNKSASNASSVSKSEMLVKQQHPYYSFLLRKIAGADFDTDLAIDTITEGALMKDINGNLLSKKEIEFIRQWITFGAKETYSSNEPKPNWNLVSQFYDSLSSNGIDRFLPKPSKPAPGAGMQIRMGPIFLPITGEIEQEYLQQQELNFPFLPEVYEIDGFMNAQSHHFLLFKYTDTTASKNNNAVNVDNLAKVTLVGNTAFDGDKDLTASWQNDANLILPVGTGLFWDQKTVLDMNYHVKNYNATFVLPCDFYFNIYFKPRNASTIEMKSQLSQKLAIFLPTGVSTSTFSDPVNSRFQGTKYLWMIAAHTHEWGTDHDLYIKDNQGNLGIKFYDGKGVQTNNGSYYENGIGYWNWKHPPIEYWPNLFPIDFGGSQNAGIVSRATYNNTTNLPLTFSTQTTGEMQLWYYMYTDRALQSTGIVDATKKNFSFDIIPNPALVNSSISYSLDKSAIVQIDIYDIMGNIIVNGSPKQQQQGNYLETIFAKISPLPGVYFAKLSIDGYISTQRFVITN